MNSQEQDIYWELAKYVLFKCIIEDDITKLGLEFRPGKNFNDVKKVFSSASGFGKKLEDIAKQLKEILYLVS